LPDYSTLIIALQTNLINNFQDQLWSNRVGLCYKSFQIVNFFKY